MKSEMIYNSVDFGYPSCGDLDEELAMEGIEFHGGWIVE